MFRSLRSRPQQCLRGVVVRHNSTAAPTAPPLLFKIKSDLKDAMRARDTARLNVLRAIISETNNAAKTPSPIKTDIQLLKLLNKRTAALKDAKGEYLEAGRADLIENANKELEVLERYASQVETISNEEVRAAVSRAIEKMKNSGEKIAIGTVIKALVGPGGSLEGKPVQVGEISKIAKELIS
ncbi:hypothetical protein RJZ56_004411 [Blastomyces dermatitidis]|uniref:Altered inheritance of mitochondria protein 41 n=2 Tax=Blastomyces TaxID=229219 RepID=A0A179U9M8_BLAGS|nr:uncharacterized protein BDBG_00646 [Blastomyces gilchristii SLH14081]XP_045277829.1 uncharacterized protein BDCG_06382 [Blastomyces dermatitidis ER-3]EEQ91262.1 hypothetical protein BDCG_06382 [Blastomyces dermatitidis ER-3]EQL31356.1 hypothetical protein BDFG_06300 [Blastomyces dermatitidis ATCC 26199]OAT04009.1 hypothetical protein BDBG_00646 [Blastomyces gilchristii SLH14081]